MPHSEAPVFGRMSSQQADCGPTVGQTVSPSGDTHSDYDSSSFVLRLSAQVPRKPLRYAAHQGRDVV